LLLLGLLVDSLWLTHCGDTQNNIATIEPLIPEAAFG
jgi:hypothetical protein